MNLGVRHTIGAEGGCLTRSIRWRGLRNVLAVLATTSAERTVLRLDNGRPRLVPSVDQNAMDLGLSIFPNDV